MVNTTWKTAKMLELEARHDRDIDDLIIRLFKRHKGLKKSERVSKVAQELGISRGLLYLWVQIIPTIENRGPQGFVRIKELNA